MALLSRSTRYTLETHPFPKFVERFVIAGSDQWFSFSLISRCSLCCLVCSSRLTWSKSGSFSVTALMLLELQDFTDNGFFSGSLAPLRRLIPSHLNPCLSGEFHCQPIRHTLRRKLCRFRSAQHTKVITADWNV